jgi:6-pyruvoyltetrahydropterin/6-carboxytetrahydropterin synthase
VTKGVYIDRVEVSFDAGHRLLNYSGKCAAPHGHTFRAEVFVAVQQLDSVGLGVDFGDLKGRLKTWIDDQWDHAFLLNDHDTRLIEALGKVKEAKLYLLQGINPSAEALARELFDVVQRQFGNAVRSVRIWESPSQYAEFVAEVSSNFGSSDASAMSSAQQLSRTLQVEA